MPTKSEVGPLDLLTGETFFTFNYKQLNYQVPKKTSKRPLKLDRKYHNIRKGTFMTS